MTPLHRRIADLIRRDGPISVERYMALCLGDPHHGYYATRDPIGAGGDFTTAPEISQMFGELTGVWMVAAWTAMQSPSLVHIVELGPGRGTLMKDALRAMGAAPGLPEAARIHLVETSPALREKQRATLAVATVPVAWHADFNSVPDGPLVLVANEFFDALPIRQFVMRESGWRERAIGRDALDALLFTEVEAADAPQEDAPIGALREISPASLAIVAEIARRMKKNSGAALIVDYGPSRCGFGDTLQAVKNHGFADPLIDPGEADLTAHVDFASLLAAARRAGAATQGPATQGAFLQAMGIEARAAALSARASPEQRNAIALALARLTDARSRTGMGVLFKAIALRSAGLPPMPGIPAETP